MVDADRIGPNPIPPPVTIEQVIVDKAPIKAGEAAPPGAGDVEIHYTGLSLLAPEKVLFKYQLEGYDRNWVEARQRRVAFFTNLPPGEYRFRVIACNNDGVWNEAGASITFRLKPHFYQTYWFYGLCALAVAGLGWGLHNLKVSRVQAQHDAVLGERNRIAREIHDTFAQEIAGLLAQLHAIKMLFQFSPQSAEKHLDRACELASAGLASARHLVLDLRHQALEDQELPAALAHVVQQATAYADLQVDFSVSGDHRPLPGPTENNLLRIGQEAVTNAVKHACASRLRVQLSYEPRSITLRVKDDGCGFDPEAYRMNGAHFGLLGLRERAAQLGGQLRLDSHPGEGTEVYLWVRTG